MSIEDRVRRVLARAVTTELPPAHPPFERVLRRRRRRPLVATTAALALLLVAAVAFTAIRSRDTRPVSPTPTTVPARWKEFRDAGTNLSFRYPPGWVVRVHPQNRSTFLIIPPELAGRRLQADRSGVIATLPFVIGVRPGGEGYYNLATAERTSRGRLPNGRGYVEWPSQFNGRQYQDYSIDAGRFCVPGAPRPDCGAHAISATIRADTPALLDRYQAVATSIVGTVAPAGPTTPSIGDRSRPPCRPDGWRLAPEPGWSFQGRSWTIQGQVRYPAAGPRCHLRVTLRLAVERPDGTPLAVPGTPAPVTIEGDLPEDRDPNDNPSADAYFSTPLSWHWAWENWCRQPLGRTRVRITAAGAGTTVTVQAPAREDYGNCRGIGPEAPWRIAPWP